MRFRESVSGGIGAAGAVICATVVLALPATAAAQTVTGVDGLGDTLVVSGPDVASVGEQVTFDLDVRVNSAGCGSAGFSDFFFAWGDGASDSSGFGVPVQEQHTYTAPGSYSITVDVQFHCANGQTGFASVLLRLPIVSPLQTDLRPSTTSGGSPLAVTFDGSHSLPGARWAMKFGDGSANASGTGAPPASIPHSYAHPGSYFATLTVYNEIGDTDSASAIISVSKAPTALAAPAGTVHTVSHTISVSATLTRTDTNTPLAGKLLFFGTGTTLVCAATTNASGVGACTGSVSPAVALNAPSAGYVVAFGGDGDTNAVSANGKLTSVANARDVAGARARSALHGTLRASSIHALRGTSPAGTQAVSVSLVRVNGSGCAQLDAHGRLVHATRVRSLCLPGLMIPAAGTRHWHLSLTGTLKRGQYRLYVWTVDADGVLRVNTQSLKLT